MGPVRVRIRGAVNEEQRVPSWNLPQEHTRRPENTGGRDRARAAGNKEVDIAQEIDLRYGWGRKNAPLLQPAAGALRRSNGVASPTAGTSARSPNGMDATRWRWR